MSFQNIIPDRFSAVVVATSLPSEIARLAVNVARVADYTAEGLEGWAETYLREALANIATARAELDHVEAYLASVNAPVSK